ncbi:MAG: HD domain-containing protein [Parachlamydiaceae bacterium]
MCFFHFFISIAAEEYENSRIQSNHYHRQLCEKLFSLLENVPKDRLHHSLQCASIALKEGGNEKMALAALFHSIGHVQQKKPESSCALDDCLLSAEILRSYCISEHICQLVLGHLQAARYLKLKEPYYQALQVNPMTLEEATLFEIDPLFNEKMRLWDLHEKAHTEFSALPLNLYRDLIIHHLNNRISI